MGKINLDKIKQEVNQNKIFWSLIFLVILSIILYCFKIPSRELYVLGSFILLAIYVIVKFIK